MTQPLPGGLPSTPSALIFDMDGTLVDNMGAHHAAWERFLGRYGIHLTLDELRRRMHGKTNREILLDIVSPRLGEDEIAALAAEKERIYREDFRVLVRPVSGLARFLASMRAARLPLAVATAASAPNVRFVFDLYDLHGAFDVVVGAEDISRGKPDPEVYLTAATRLGVPPGDCLAFEDSFPGIESAHRAGMPVVALTTGHSEDELCQAPGVIRVIADYDDFDAVAAPAHLSDTGAVCV